MKRILTVLACMVIPSYSIAGNVNDANGESPTPDHNVTPPSPAADEQSIAEQKSGTNQPQPRLARPQEPSQDILSLIIEAGLNRLQEYPQEMTPSFQSSYVMKGALYYNIQFGTSPFTFSPGIGFSSETYQFNTYRKRHYTLVRDADRHTALEAVQQMVQYSKKTLYSQLNCKYIDFMAELRIHGNSQFPKEHLHVAIGGRLSVRLSAYTRFGYQEDNASKTRTTAESFNLSRIRYGVYGRLGWNRFGVYYNWMFAPLFEKDKGPNGAAITSHHLCASINLF